MLQIRSDRIIFACIDRHYVRVFDKVLIGSRFIIVDRNSFRSIRLQEFARFLAQSKPPI